MLDCQQFRTMGRGAKYAGEMADIAPQYQEEFFATKLPQALGSTVPFIAAGGIAGAAARGAGLAAKGVKAAQYITPGVVGAVVGGEEQIKDMEATLGRKLTPEERKTAFAAGTPVGATEMLPIGRMLGRAGGAGIAKEPTESLKSGAMEVFKKAGAGALEEVLCMLHAE